MIFSNIDLVVVVVVVLAVSILVGVVSYRFGKVTGLNYAKLAGAYCDVCHTVSEKFVYYKMTVMCEKCFHAISKNKDMKCQFCQHPVEKCVCS